MIVVLVVLVVLVYLGVRFIPTKMTTKDRKQSIFEENVQDVIFIPNIDDAFDNCDFIGVGLDNPGAVVHVNDPAGQLIDDYFINTVISSHYFRKSNI